MADKTGPNPSNRQVQHNVNKNTNQQVQSIRKLVQGVPPGIEGPKDPAGNYDKNIAANNNTATQKQTSQQKNQQKQQMSVFQLLAQSVAKIEQMLTDLFTRQKQNKIEQDKQLKELNENVEKLTKQFSTDLNKKLEKPLSTLIDTLNTLNDKLDDKIEVNLSDNTINALNTKLSTTLTPTLKDIDLTPLISEKLKEIDLNSTLTGKLTGDVDLTSIISGKVKEINLTDTLNEKIIFDTSELTKSINNQLSTIFSKVELNTIVEKNIKPIKIDVNDKIDVDVLNQSLSKTFSKIKFDSIDLTDAISKKVKATTLDLNDKVKVKDVTINVNKTEKGQKTEKTDNGDLKSISDSLLGINEYLFGINEKLQILTPTIPKDDTSKKTSGGRTGGEDTNILGLINARTEKEYLGITTALGGISDKITQIDNSLNGSFNDVEKKNRLDVISAFQKDITEAVTKIAEKIDTAISDYFDKSDSKFYQNFRHIFDESLEKKLEKTPGIETQTYSVTGENEISSQNISINGIDNEHKELEDVISLVPTSTNKLVNQALTVSAPLDNAVKTPIQREFDYNEYYKNELTKLTNLVDNISKNTIFIHHKLDNIKVNKETPTEQKDITLTQNGKNIPEGSGLTLRSNVSDVFKYLGSGLKNKIKYNRFIDFEKFASNFKKPIKVQNQQHDIKAPLLSVSQKLTDNKPGKFSFTPNKNSFLSVASSLLSKFEKKSEKQKQPYSLDNYLTSYGKYNTLQEVIAGKVGKGLKSLGKSISELNLGVGEGKSFSVDSMKDLMSGKNISLDTSDLVSKLGGETISGGNGFDISKITDSIGDLKNIGNIAKQTKNIANISKAAANVGKVGSVVGSVGAAAGAALVAGTAIAAAHGAKNASKWNDQIGNTNGQSVTGSQAVDGAFASINHYFGEGFFSRIGTAMKTGKINKLWGANNQLDNEYTEAEHMALMSMGKDKADELKLERQTGILQKRLDEYNKGSIYAEYDDRMSVQNNLLTKQIDKVVGTQDSSLVGNTVSLDNLNTQQLSNISKATTQRSGLIKFQSLTNTNIAANLMSDDFVNKMSDLAGDDVTKDEKERFGPIHNTLLQKARFYNTKTDAWWKLPTALKLAILSKAAMEGQLQGGKVNYLDTLNEEELEDNINQMDRDRSILLNQDNSYENQISLILSDQGVKYSKGNLKGYKKHILSPLNLQMLNLLKKQLDLKKQAKQNNMQKNIAEATVENKRNAIQIQPEQLHEENMELQTPSSIEQTTTNAVEQTVKNNNNTSSTQFNLPTSSSSNKPFFTNLPQKDESKHNAVEAVVVKSSDPIHAIYSQNQTNVA